MSDGSGPASGPETTNFTIGSRVLAVPPLNLYVLEQCQQDIRALTPDMSLTDYALRVLRVVQVSLADAGQVEDIDALKRQCSMADMRRLVDSMNELLDKSGFSLGEAEAAGETNGTGISNPSLPPSPPTESAAETSGG